MVDMSDSYSYDLSTFTKFIFQIMCRLIEAINMMPLNVINNSGIPSPPFRTFPGLENLSESYTNEDILSKLKRIFEKPNGDKSLLCHSIEYRLVVNNNDRLNKTISYVLYKLLSLGDNDVIDLDLSNSLNRALDGCVTVHGMDMVVRSFITECGFNPMVADFDVDEILHIGSIKLMTIGYTKKKKMCLVCKSSSGTKVCSTCHSVRYCSRECQRKDWVDNHKKICPHLLKYKLRW